MNVFSVISLLGGLALFLYGMEIMGDGLRSSSGSALKKVLSKVTSNPFTGFLLGLVITAVVQSSMATVVLTVGLVGAGVLTLKQSISIVFGANVGTTVTAQIIRLIDAENSSGGILAFFQPSTLAPAALFIGIILIMFVKGSTKSKNIGNIIVGFGVLFTGLMNMISSSSGLSDSETFKNILLKFSENPVLGTLLGILITVIIQSSSASVGILQTLCVGGAVTFNGAYTYVLGAAIGTGIVTFVMCALDKKTDSKRLGFIHLCFNIFGALMFFVIIGFIKAFGGFPEVWNSPVSGGDVANFETVFKLVTALMLLFFIPYIENLVRKIFKDKTDSSEREFELDEKLFLSPGVALAQAERTVSEMGRLAKENYSLAVLQYEKFDKKRHSDILSSEERIDRLTDSTERFLIAMSPHIDEKSDSDRQSYLLRVISEFERIGDLSLNLSETAQSMKDERIAFSENASKELDVLFSAAGKAVDVAYRAFNESDVLISRNVEPVEEVVDDIVETLKKRHYARLKKGGCDPQSGIPFTDVISNCERISDQCSNIAIYVMGLENEYIHFNEHDYIKRVHSGETGDFKRLYENEREIYIGKLNEINE